MFVLLKLFKPSYLPLGAVLKAGFGLDDGMTSAMGEVNETFTILQRGQLDFIEKL